jgi:hypothetical protein
MTAKEFFCRKKRLRQLVSIKILQEALDIINLYEKQSRKKEDFIFPILKNCADYSDKMNL